MIAQGPNECAGCSIAAIELFFARNGSINVDESNADDFSRIIRRRGHTLYELGVSNSQNAITEAPRNRGDFIELNCIYNARTSDNHNIIFINESLQLQFET